MEELSHKEIDAVFGGDAGATRTAGQNSWGEAVFGGYAHYQEVYTEAIAHEFLKILERIVPEGGDGSTFKEWNALY